jgi:hypothetical protein
VNAQRTPRRRKPGPQPSEALVDAVCDECWNVRKVKASGIGRICRELRCTPCGRTTIHYAAPTTCDESDWWEQRNAEQNQKNAILYAQLHASIVLLDRLGIRFDYEEADEWYAMVWRERGRGSEAVFIWLAADLTPAEQVDYLARAWRDLLPAAESDWLGRWCRDEEDPEMESLSMWWPRS